MQAELCFRSWREGCLSRHTHKKIHPYPGFPLQKQRPKNSHPTYIPILRHIQQNSPNPLLLSCLPLAREASWHLDWSLRCAGPAGPEADALGMWSWAWPAAVPEASLLLTGASIHHPHSTMPGTQGSARPPLTGWPWHPATNKVAVLPVSGAHSKLHPTYGLLAQAGCQAGLVPLRPGPWCQARRHPGGPWDQPSAPTAAGTAHSSQAAEHNGRRPLEPTPQRGCCLLHTPWPHTSEKRGHEAPACLHAASLSTGDTRSPTNRPVPLAAQHEHQTPPKQGTLTNTPLTGWSHCLDNTCFSGAHPETSTPTVGWACQEKAIANTQLPLQAEQFLNLPRGQGAGRGHSCLLPKAAACRSTGTWALLTGRSSCSR